VARNFAEGFCDLFKLMLKLVCQHQQQDAEFKVNGEWLKINPGEWRNQFDVTINVGLGVGNKDQRVSHLMALSQKQMEGVQFGVATPVNLYNTGKELAKEMGFKSADKFFTDPSKNPPPQHPDPEQMKAQAQMPLIQAKGQIDAQLKQMELQAESQHKQIDAQATMQVERDKMQMQAQVDQHRQEVEAQQQEAKRQGEAQLAQYMAQLDKDKEDARLQHEYALEQLRQQAAREVAEMNNSTKIAVAQIAAQQANNAALMAAQNAADSEIATEVGGDEAAEKADPLASLASMHGDLMTGIAGLVKTLSNPKPKTILRDADGRAVGVQ